MMVSSRVASRTAMSISRRLVSSAVEILPQHLHRAGQCSQGIPDFMRHARRHLAQTGQPFLAPHFFFEISDLSEIFEHANQSVFAPLLMQAARAVMPRMSRLPSARLHSTSNRIMAGNAVVSAFVRSADWDAS